ncbi:hypothetical protein A3770_04p29040 [Chloropicon primus]|uniref:Uncharacterized protein n=1 Tax=Chloropicon primus TaxID=1764295 RepID=A0A5B8MIR6_9CHLO|nr:hypothetical protein A3770_04p29040 [Chloropicon primus]|eukprot:QDZ20386.1 hypothetical protein A3770_04p29040 [Chloropicon primus]
MSWLFRGRGGAQGDKGASPGSEKKSKPTKAHLGEKSKFYYNENLKRWCVEGEEGEEDGADGNSSGIAPPPMSRNVSLDYLPGEESGQGSTEGTYNAVAPMPGSPRRGASLRQRYYDPGYMNKASSSKDDAESNGVPGLPLPDKPPLYGGNLGSGKESVGLNTPGKKPITLFVPQMKSQSHSGVGNEERRNSGMSDSHVTAMAPTTHNFSTPWSASEGLDSQAYSEGEATERGQGEKEEEVVEGLVGEGGVGPTTDGAVAEVASEQTEEWPARRASFEEAFGASENNGAGEEDAFEVQDQFAHLDYDKAKLEYFEEKERQGGVEGPQHVQNEESSGDNPRLDDLSGGYGDAGLQPPAGQVDHQDYPSAYAEDPLQGDEFGSYSQESYQPQYTTTENGGYDYGYQQGQDNYGVEGQQQEGLEVAPASLDPAGSSSAYPAENNGYDSTAYAGYDYNSNVAGQGGEVEQPLQNDHQWHSFDLDSQGGDQGGDQQSLDKSSYNSSYNNMAQLEKVSSLQQQLDDMTAKLQAAASERERMQGELERERSAREEAERLQVSTSSQESGGKQSGTDDEGKEPSLETPLQPAGAPQATPAGGTSGGNSGSATYSTIKRSLQEKIEELELNDLEKHKLLLENYRLQESMKEKDSELSSIQSDMNDLLVCLGQESAKVQALVPYAEQAGEDVDALLAKVEEESALEQEQEEGEGEGEEGGEEVSEEIEL